MWLALKYCWAKRLVCFGSLSCWKRCVVWIDPSTPTLWRNFAAMNGRSPFSRIAIYRVAFIIPVNKTAAVAPLLDIAAHMWILNGCFGLGLNFRGWFALRKVILPYFSKATVLSSLKMTSSKYSSSCKHFKHQSYCFFLFASLMNWQWRGVVETQPSCFLTLLMVDKEKSWLSLN